MGAEVFTTRARGRNAQEAFWEAVEQANYDHGHSGYTGTIAEKDSFVMIDLPEGEKPWRYADKLINDEDPRIDDKWGPAGCIKLDEEEYFFFGWASS
jgi:hypothetical protein